jgi:diguanylate cyclase (GGDEF)-like protein
MAIDASRRVAPLSTRLSETLESLIGKATRIRPPAVLAITGLAILLTGLADLVASAGVWFGPLYLLSILFCAWTLGWRAGVATGLACVAIGLIVNGFQTYPLGAVAIAWNMAMRILTVTVIVILVSACRRSYDREWLCARHDALTGALNTQGFYEFAARRHDPRRWGILVYVDLDGFKQINDRFGHAAGDETLRAFAHGVRHHIRPEDALARIGGDEFLLLLRVGDEADGHRLGRQLHARMNGILERAVHPARCSVGVLVLKPGAAAPSADDVRLADQLMYEAKQRGAMLRIATIDTIVAASASPPADRLDRSTDRGMEADRLRAIPAGRC